MDSIPSEARVVKSVPPSTLRLYVQPRMFTTDGPCPVLAQLSVALVDGSWSVGASVVDLASLEPLAITAGPGQQDVPGREEAHAMLDELLDVAASLGQLEPFA